MSEFDLFSPDPEAGSDAAFLERLESFVAPVARQSDAVVKDPAMLNWAQAVYEAFGDLDDTGEGLTAAELEAACGHAGPGTFESRLNVFKALGLLRSPKPHHHRLIFNPTGVAALLLFDRLRHDDGVQEILLLLDRTTKGIEDGLLGPDDVTARLATLRRALAINAGELARLRSRPVDELLVQRRNHRAADRLLSDARTLVELVETRFPQLSAAGGQLITQGLKRFVLPRPRLVDLTGPFAGNSLPSGHTTIAMTVLFAALLVVPYRWRGVALFFVLFWAVGIGAYTITAKWHRLSDTLVADAIALGLACLASWWLARRDAVHRYDGPRKLPRVLVVSFAAATGVVFLALGGLLIGAALIGGGYDDTVHHNAWVVYLAANSLASAGSIGAALVFLGMWRRLQIT